MNSSGIGVQKILPRSGTGWKGQRRSPGQGDESRDDSADAAKTDSTQQQPELGRFVDRSA